jgi:hypothetical protein
MKKKSDAEKQDKSSHRSEMQILESAVSTINTGTESSSGAREGVLIKLSPRGAIFSMVTT